MIVAAENKPKADAFEDLLKETVTMLIQEARKDVGHYLQQEGQRFEKVVCDMMIKKATRTPFAGKIQLISGHKFPDIVAKKHYGVEVKTSRQGWRSTGNSVLETTRIEDVERIYLMFGKMSKPIDVRFKPYEECLYDVAVTHSPRYLIDMEISQEETIFSKINQSYEKVSASSNPISPFIEYYRSIAKPGEDVWWLEGSQESESELVLPPTIRLWNNLSPTDQTEILSKALALFPEIFGNSSKKFNRFSIWLVQKFGIVHPNARDPFTAGGRCVLSVGGKDFRLPRIFDKLRTHLHKVVEAVENLSDEDAKYYWDDYFTGYGQKLPQWIEAISNESNSLPMMPKNFKTKDFIRERLETFNERKN